MIKFNNWLSLKESTHGHFIKKCSCGEVIEQCRCGGPKKETIVKNGCEKCQKAAT